MLLIPDTVESRNHQSDSNDTGHGAHEHGNPDSLINLRNSNVSLETHRTHLTYHKSTKPKTD